MAAKKTHKKKAQMAKKKRVARKTPKTGGASKPVVKKAQGGKTDGRRDSEKKRRLAKLITENFGKEKPLTYEQMCVKAGYSPETARGKAKQFMDAAREEPEVKDFVERLKKHREKILERMETKIGTAGYVPASMGLSTVNKAIDLAEGKPTSRVQLLAPEEKDELDEILDDNT